MNKTKAEDGRTPLHFAAAKGHLETVKIFLNVIKDKNPVSHYGRTPLHYAAEAGHINVVKFLVENGALVNAKEKYGATPLYISVQEGKIDVVKYLIEKGYVAIDGISLTIGEVSNSRFNLHIIPETMNFICLYLTLIMTIDSYYVDNMLLLQCNQVN